MHFNIIRCRCPSHQLATDIKIRILVNKIKTEQRKLKKLQKIACSYRCSRIIIILTEISKLYKMTDQKEMQVKI